MLSVEELKMSKTRQIGSSKINEQAFRKKGAAEHFLSPLGLSLKSDPPAEFDNNEDPLEVELQTRMFWALDFLKYWIRHSTNEVVKKKLVRFKNAIRNRIVCANIGLIYRAMQLTPIKADTDTFLSAGHIALIDSVENYDYHFGIRFSTYATVSILRRFNRDCRRRQLNIQEDMDPADVLDDAAEHAESEEKCFQVEKLRHLLDASSGVLTQDDIDILCLRFNIDSQRDQRMTLQEIATSRGRSKERIRQLQQEAILKLRQAFGVKS
jgi:RNA polymerase sigma factor (sigma-70 family)